MTDRHGDWMQTYTGRQFWPLDPRPEEINIIDIAHHLSQLCRYGGATRFPYSVAQHSVLLATWCADNGYDERTQLAALLHDASEAYLSDVIRPIKPFLSGYAEAEAALMAVIGLRFGLDFEAHPMIKTIDTRILSDERVQVLNPCPIPWKAEWSLEPLGVRIESWSPSIAKERFLLAFYDIAWEIRN